MIELSLFAWLAIGGLIVLSSAGGLLISRALPWSETAVRKHVATAFGLALAPFMVGFSTISVMWALPQFSHRTHLALSLLFILLSAATAFFLKKKQVVVASGPIWKADEIVLLSGLCFPALALLLIAVFTPLTQNDSLEYAM